MKQFRLGQPLKNKLLQFLLVAAPFSCAIAQPPADEQRFDQYVNSVLINEQKLSADKIIAIGDSLYQISKNDRQRIRSLFVSINGYHMSADRVNALKYSLMADSLAEKSGSELVSRTSGMVASQYRSLKLYDESIAYLQKALKNANRLKGTNVPTTKIMVYNELGAIHYEKADYEKTIETVKEQLALIAEAGQAFPDSSFQHMLAIHLRPAYLNLGRSYYELEELDSAKSYFSKAKDLYAQSRQPLPPWQETDLNIKLADIEIAEGDADTALAYLTTATSLVAELDDRELEHELDIVFNRYYELINDYQKSDSIKRKIIAHVADRHHSSAEASRYILQKEKANADLLKSKSDLLLVLLALTLLVIIVVVIIFQKKNKKARANFERIIAAHKNPELNTQMREKQTDQSPVRRENGNNRLLAEDTERELLNKLVVFETGTAFTEKNFTISKLAALMGTNTRYVNHILQNHRNKNFNDYLNSLRIKFIIQKMIDNPEFLNYKINYLAELSGYSSHSRFAQMFKQETNISPSQFISRLSQEQEKRRSAP
ncbi:helix-turn-helix domain-containing protein [Parapedobacter sp. ISTM3]|uniref:helix-turn-helix domain-containing protein n=1 Tax=Parapedobacter sp. ISTM3 TaxID=2800130 RepID=UPI0019067EEA|nr:helix-turn-helix domain-containing protein [Parapedobacter sp. ISTM3]MBK1439116.1 helix-turn-helix domain-containing protein [Parapedobacter sp. ISTM3]